MADITANQKSQVALPERSLALYLQEVNKIPSLTEEEEYLLAKSYIDENNLSAAQKLVTSHLKLVAKIALKYRNYGLPSNELISEGNIGLMHAVKKFRPDLGFRLSTYAIWWIKAAIQEYILKSWSLVKLGTTAAQKKLFFSLGKMKNKIRSSEMREVQDSDYQEIALSLGVDKAEVAEMDRRLSHSDLSLNQISSTDGDSRELIELIPENRPSQYDVLAQREEHAWRKDVLQRALSSLTEREFFIIQERKLKEENATLEELSQKLDISKERVRQIETRAFEKMQLFVMAEKEMSKKELPYYN
ncbi:MAG: RNA polymerase sigma factor RpoH [Rickettsiaceae bacterium]|nr:RNA polymerase sigma factor RpoH [Rickettsiaceae bacterium]